MAKQPTTLHASSLVIPAKESRRDKKARLRAAASIYTAANSRNRTDARARYDAERTQAKATTYLPPGGDTGPAALRSYRRFRVPTHQDTSARLAGAYPFLAEGGMGSAGVFVGQDLYSSGSFVYDPWEMYRQGVITAPNIVLAGIVGSGKSSLAKSLYTRPGQSRSVGACTCPGIRKVSTRPSPKPSAGKRSSSGTG